MADFIRVTADAGDRRTEYIERNRRSMRLLLLFICFAVVAVFFFRNFQVAVVEGKSMEPTLAAKSYVLVTRAYWLFGPPKINDIVVLRHGDDLIVKRLVDVSTNAEYGAVVYVLGDNPAVSEDSRTFGYVPLSDVVGKLVRSPEPPTGASFDPRAPWLRQHTLE